MRRFVLQFRLSHFYSILPQIIFWVCSYTVLLKIFSGSHPRERIDYIYTFIFISTLILSVMVHFQSTIFKYLDKGKHSLFFIAALGNILFFAFFNHLLFSKLIDYILPGYYFISYYTYLDLTRFFFVFIVLTTLLHLSWEWWQLQETRHRLIALEKEKVKAELVALTNQVNPHFLFNSLTVLYSLSLQSAAETSKAIIKLSDILRYVIYESTKPSVSISAEAEMIRSYIDLQRYRIHQSVSVRFQETIESDIPIAPMLLLPLVENAFKHGVQGSPGDFIEIFLQVNRHDLRFSVRNNNSNTAEKKETSGIGIKNLEERLKLIYPEQFAFSVTENEEEFLVDLKIDRLS